MHSGKSFVIKNKTRAVGCIAVLIIIGCNSVQSNFGFEVKESVNCDRSKESSSTEKDASSQFQIQMTRIKLFKFAFAATNELEILKSHSDSLHLTQAYQKFKSGYIQKVSGHIRGIFKTKIFRILLQYVSVTYRSISVSMMSNRCMRGQMQNG